MSEQNLKNHVRFDATFMFVLVGILSLNLIAAIIHLFRHPGWHMVWFLVLSLTALVAVTKMRMYAIKVQDRVIRLEERIRLQALAPSEWHTQIYRLSIDQLIALRFAADDEVIELAKQALEHGLNRKQIKERIKNWRGDDWRV